MYHGVAEMSSIYLQVFGWEEEGLGRNGRGVVVSLQLDEVGTTEDPAVEVAVSNLLTAPVVVYEVRHAVEGSPHRSESTLCVRPLMVDLADLFPDVVEALRALVE